MATPFAAAADIDYRVPTLDDDRPDIVIGVGHGWIRTPVGKGNVQPGREVREAFDDAFAYAAQMHGGRIGVVLEEPGEYAGVNNLGIAMKRSEAHPCPVDPGSWSKAITLSSHHSLAGPATVDGLGVWGLPHQCELRLTNLILRVPLGGAYALGTPQFHRTNAIRGRSLTFQRHPGHTGYSGLGAFSWMRFHGGCGTHFEDVLIDDPAKEHVLGYEDNSDFSIRRNCRGPAGSRTSIQHYSRQDSSPAPLSWQGIFWTDLDFEAFEDDSYDGALYTVGGYAGDIVLRGLRATGGESAPTGCIAVWAPASLGGPYLTPRGFANGRVVIDGVDFSGVHSGKVDSISVGGAEEVHIRNCPSELLAPAKRWINVPGTFSGAENGRVVYHRTRAHPVAPELRTYTLGSKSWVDAVEHGYARVV